MGGSKKKNHALTGATTARHQRKRKHSLYHAVLDVKKRNLVEKDENSLDQLTDECHSTTLPKNGYCNEIDDSNQNGIISSSICSMTRISETDMNIAINVLQTLNNDPILLQSKACKDLRRVLFPLVQKLQWMSDTNSRNSSANNQYNDMKSFPSKSSRIENSSSHPSPEKISSSLFHLYTNNVTNSLQNEQWIDAIYALQQCWKIIVATNVPTTINTSNNDDDPTKTTGTATMAFSGSNPKKLILKHGTIQRWVRSCDKCPEPRYKTKLLYQLLRLLSLSSLQSIHATYSNNFNGSSSTENADAVVKQQVVMLANEVRQKMKQQQTKQKDRQQQQQQQQSNIDLNVSKRDDDFVNNGNEEDELVIVLDGWCIPESNNYGTATTATTTNNICSIPTAADEDDCNPFDRNNGNNKISNNNECHFESIIVYQEDACDRKPPNHYDLLLHMIVQPNVLQWSSSIPKNITTSTSTTTEDGSRCTRITNNQQAPTIQRYHIPFIQDAFCITNVLKQDEIQQFRTILTKLGYRPDHPITNATPTGIDSCEWYVDEEYNNIAHVLFQRVRDHLPLEIQVQNISSNNGTTATKTASQTTVVAKLHSINRRFRCFRYGKDCVYRPHIDGSWPISFVRDEEKEQKQCTDTNSTNSNNPHIHTTNQKMTMMMKKKKYKYSCDETGSIKSYFTFLIYLSDDFDGGETRFYSYVPKTLLSMEHDALLDENSSTPRVASSAVAMDDQDNANNDDHDNDDKDGYIVAKGIVPKAGSVLVFPQGNLASLIHEGANVTRGTKYVIRTDVLYSHHPSI